MRNLSRHRYVAFALLAGLAAACRAVATLASTPAPETPFPLATPHAQEPAAGICAQPDGDEVVMRLEPGIPDPRCLIVLPGQHLRVINHTGAEVMVGLGPFSASLASDGEIVFETPFSRYLMPGVHSLDVDPCCGGELWLKE